MPWWKQRNEGEAHNLEHLLFQFYTRQGCHLCDRALARLRQAQLRHRFRIDVIDVDADPDLVGRHGNWVPVVALDGKVRFRGAINAVLLDRLLQGEAARSKL